MPARNGAPVPPADTTPRVATQLIAVGETYDFEYDAPASRHDLWIDVRGPDGSWRVQGRAVLNEGYSFETSGGSSPSAVARSI